MRGILFVDRESESGKMLNQYLQNRDYKFSDEAIHLLFAVNRWEMKEQILKDLRAGITIVCDRYAFSGVAYSAAKVWSFSL
jgi:dTMP kinase